VNILGLVWLTCLHRRLVNPCTDEFLTLSVERLNHLLGHLCLFTRSAEPSLFEYGSIRLWFATLWSSSGTPASASRSSPITLTSTSQTITWLIIARAVAGIGGGGIVCSVWVITAEIVSYFRGLTYPCISTISQVEIRKRAKWSQALSVTWSCSAIAGPLLGGLFSSEF
jgi:MFS family permease